MPTAEFKRLFLCFLGGLRLVMKFYVGCAGE